MKNKTRLNTPLKSLFYVIFVGLFLSGLFWLLIQCVDLSRYSGASEMAVWLLKTHGGAAMGSLIVFGWLIPSHLQIGWKKRQNRLPGSLITAAYLLLALSGYGLYYFGGETLRSLTVWAHCIIGICFPALLAWHIWMGRKKV